MVDQAAIDRHLQTVIGLSKPGEALAVGSSYATVNNPEWFEERRPGQREPTRVRRRLHDRLIAEQWSGAPHVQEGGKAVVLAGPPGAGKSSIRKELCLPR